MATIQRPLIIDAGRRRLLASGEVLPGAALDQIVGIQPTLDLDFVAQNYRHYTAALGLRAKSLSDIVTFTRASSASYFDAKGVLINAASDAPRIEFNPTTGAAKGLLIEGSKKNLIDYSEQFDNVAWAKYTLSIATNTITALDGTLTADKLIANVGVNASHYISQTKTVVMNSDYVWSVFAKAAEYSKIYLYTYNASGDAEYCYADLATGTLRSIGCSPGAFIQPAGNGWYRVGLILNNSIDTASNVLIRVLSNAWETTFDGDGTSGIYIWGAQFALGSQVSSYIKTESATVTRAADVCSISGTPFTDFYSSTGTLLVKYASAGWKHVLSPTLTSLDLTLDIATAAPLISDYVQRVIFYPRELTTAAIDQIKAVV